MNEWLDIMLAESDRRRRESEATLDLPRRYNKRIISDNICNNLESRLWNSSYARSVIPSR